MTQTYRVNTTSHMLSCLSHVDLLIHFKKVVTFCFVLQSTDYKHWSLSDPLAATEEVGPGSAHFTGYNWFQSHVQLIFGVERFVFAGHDDCVKNIHSHTKRCVLTKLGKNPSEFSLSKDLIY